METQPIESNQKTPGSLMPHQLKDCNLSNSFNFQIISLNNIYYPTFILAHKRK